MKKWMYPAIVLALASVAGCAGSDKTYAQAGHNFVNVTVGPEYEGYVNRDASLNPEQKLDRLQNVASFREATRIKMEGR